MSRWGWGEIFGSIGAILGMLFIIWLTSVQRHLVLAHVGSMLSRPVSCSEHRTFR